MAIRRDRALSMQPKQKPMIEVLLDEYEASEGAAVRYRARVERILALLGHRVLRAPSREGILKVLHESYTASSRVSYRSAWEHFVVWLRVSHAVNWPSLKDQPAQIPVCWEDIAILYLGLGKPPWGHFGLLYQQSFVWDKEGVSYQGGRLSDEVKTALVRQLSWGQGSPWIFPAHPGSTEVMAPDELRRGLLSWRDAVKTAEAAQIAR